MDLSPTFSNAKVFATSSKDKIEDWKSKLSSAAMDGNTLSWALLVLSAYYFTYSAYESFNDNNKRFQGDCKCNKNHEVFYVTLFCCYTVTWTVGHFLILINNQIKFCKCCCTTRKKLTESQIQLNQYEQHLWIQFYKTQTVGHGVLKHEQDFDLNKVRDMFKTKPRQDTKKAVLTSNDVYTPCEIRIIWFVWKFCAIGLYLLRYFVAQVPLVPLLFLQIYDSYAFRCFIIKDTSCSMRSQYQLHLYQTYVTASFYICLAVSYMTSTMLQWLPWSKPHKLR